MNGFLELNDMMNKNLHNRKSGISNLGEIENSFLQMICDCSLTDEQISSIKAHAITKKEVFDNPEKYESVELVNLDILNKQTSFTK